MSSPPPARRAVTSTGEPGTGDPAGPAASLARQQRSEDQIVLRLVSVRRDWMSKYNVLIALARNPKCPIGVVVPLINRLTLRDLKALKDDKGVSDVVRQMSRKLFQQRSKKT